MRERARRPHAINGRATGIEDPQGLPNQTTRERERERDTDDWGLLVYRGWGACSGWWGLFRGVTTASSTSFLIDIARARASSLAARKNVEETWIFAHPWLEDAACREWWRLRRRAARPLLIAGLRVGREWNDWTNEMKWIERFIFGEWSHHRTPSSFISCPRYRSACLYITSVDIIGRYRM